MPALPNLREGMEIVAATGHKVGRIGDIIVGEDSREARFFAIEGGIFRKGHLVPREALEKVDAQGLGYVRLRDTDLTQLPEYDGDAPTEEEAHQAIQLLSDRMQRALAPNPEPFAVLPHDDEERRGRYRLEWSWGPVPPDEGARL